MHLPNDTAALPVEYWLYAIPLIVLLIIIILKSEKNFPDEGLD
jgi:hypothetical protein